MVRCHIRQQSCTPNVLSENNDIPQISNYYNIPITPPKSYTRGGIGIQNVEDYENSKLRK